ncbi:hypothetical protein H8B15_13665 [Hymenobacter sp. BT507]|uniref:Uncharacterized protein n=1 Tax=Hymenobacter citatus TaxID=2763506 RepID=A0ABR7MLM6_9BACT|nr:hypothetical protein [Hymenobacter citatus]
MKKEVVSTDLWSYINRHHQALESEHIRPFHQRVFLSLQRVYRNHGGWQELEIVWPNFTISQSFSDFDVTPFIRSFSGKGITRNIYFRRNQRTHVYQLCQRLQAASEAPDLTQAEKDR